MNLLYYVTYTKIFNKLFCIKFIKVLKNYVMHLIKSVRVYRIKKKFKFQFQFQKEEKEEFIKFIKLKIN